MDGNDMDGRDVIVVPSVPKQPQTKKLVTRTGDSKPVFPPVVITYDKNGKEQNVPARSRQ